MEERREAAMFAELYSIMAPAQSLDLNWWTLFRWSMRWRQSTWKQPSFVVLSPIRTNLRGNSITRSKMLSEREDYERTCTQLLTQFKTLKPLVDLFQYSKLQTSLDSSRF